MLVSKIYETPVDAYGDVRALAVDSRVGACSRGQTLEVVIGWHVAHAFVCKADDSARRMAHLGTTVAHDINGCRHVALDFFYIVRISLLSSFLHIRVPIIVKIMVNNKAALA